MCLLTALAYAPSVTGWFVYEDHILPERSQIARGLVRWSHDATIAVAGDGAMPARIVSLGWHLLNGLLVWLLARPHVTGHGAAVVLALALLHPLQTESVAYLAGRPELMAATWILLACLASSRGWIVLAGVCAGLAITGKEMGVMAWALVPLYAYVTGQRWTRRQRLGWGVLALAMGTLFAWRLPEHGLAIGSLWYVAGQLAAAGRLLLLTIESLLVRTALTIDHDWTWITKATAAVAVSLWSAALAVSWRWCRPIAVALVATLIALLPRLIVEMPDGLHERHLYTPMLAVSLAIGVAWCPKERCR